MVWRRDRYWDPYDIVREIQEEIDSIFRDFMKGPRIWSYHEPGESIAISETWREPFADIFDRGDRFVITVELPGVRKEDIKLRVTKDAVYIEAQIRREKELEEEGAIRIERYYSGYRRVIRLPEEVIPEKAKARYNNGVLEIELPKKNPRKAEGEGVEIQIE